MKKHNIIKGLGIVLVIIGFILGRTYYVYPGDLGRTISELIPAFAFLMLGAVTILVGTRTDRQCTTIAMAFP